MVDQTIAIMALLLRAKTILMKRGASLVKTAVGCIRVGDVMDPWSVVSLIVGRRTVPGGDVEKLMVLNSLDRVVVKYLARD